MSAIRLVHAKVELALHALRRTPGRPLLLLHGLGERSPDALPEEAAGWPGPVFALDFTGHGASTVPVSGGYTAEVLMGDVDTALRHLGEATVLGRGLGAYVALLIAGARPEKVRGAILTDGLGLAGGGAQPGSPTVVHVDPEAVSPPDPFALAELSRDLRPADYATVFVRQALELSGLEQPIAVCGAERPEWLRAVAADPGVEVLDLADALALYARS